MQHALIGRGGTEDHLHALDPRAVVRQPAARHGGADNLWLHMRRVDGQLRLDIRDDGRGAGGELRFGNGLRGMRERLQAIGGGVEAMGGVQRGVHLAAWLPIIAPTSAAAPA